MAKRKTTKTKATRSERDLRAKTLTPAKAAGVKGGVARKAGEEQTVYLPFTLKE